MAPFLRSSALLEKRGEERGEVYEKGGSDTDRPKIQQSKIIIWCIVEKRDEPLSRSLKRWRLSPA